MGARPRLAGQGELLVPEWVTVGRDGAIVGQFGAEHYDPFERRPDGLFLAESFARLDLGRPRKVRTWLLANGVLDHAEFMGADEAHDPYLDFEDERDDLVREQHEVRLVLFGLGVLTITLPPPAGDGRPWDPGWHPQSGWSPDIAVRPGLPDAWRDPTRENNLRLQAFLMNEYVERALNPSLVLGQVGPLPLRPDQRRRWSSILAPIYLQLYEALRRISEGKPGARGCRECRQIFLVLDGRREAFCTAAERARFNQRAYRARRQRIEGLSR